jgi:hypothetical protein
MEKVGHGGIPRLRQNYRRGPAIGIRRGRSSFDKTDGRPLAPPRHGKSVMLFGRSEQLAAVTPPRRSL